MNFASVCSGIEAASIAFKPLGMRASWFSEIADFPSRVLKYHYPDIKNYGDMNDLPNLIKNGDTVAPEMLCGGTPCQAFSLAGWKKGLEDSRGQLSIKFIEIADAIHEKRKKENKPAPIILWENVEGVLRDRTNAFGIFIAALAGLDEEITVKRWTNSGVLFGPKRNIVWRLLDAKFFGLPHQRKRLFVVATDKNTNPETILLETTKYSEKLFNGAKNIYNNNNNKTKNKELSLFPDELGSENIFIKSKYINNQKFEVFREYTDCLYTAYGTKWNGNAAAYNGSLYISQNDKVRRLTPLECERLMGFSDNYTLIPKVKDTNRYQAIGNSWAIPVARWIGKKIQNTKKQQNTKNIIKRIKPDIDNNSIQLYLFDNDFVQISSDNYLNVSIVPNEFRKGNIFDIIQTDPPKKFFITDKGSAGILRRKKERNIKMNKRLETLFQNAK